MGSHHTVTETIRGLPYCTGTTGGVPGVHREGPPAPEGLMGCVGQGPAPRGLGAPSLLGPLRLGFGGNPKGGRPLAWGASRLPLGRRPPLDLI